MGTLSEKEETDRPVNRADLVQIAPFNTFF